jgi:Flp pilus assembly pilin Flp
VLKVFCISSTNRQDCWNVYQIKRFITKSSIINGARGDYTEFVGSKLQAFWKTFHKSELGQDLAECCLISALVALVALGIYIHVSGGVQSIFGKPSPAPVRAAGGSPSAVSATAGQ